VQFACPINRCMCRMFNNAVSTQPTPRYLSSDNDPLFRYQRRQANLRSLEIQEIKSVPYVPLSHPFVERLIGTIRREFLDQYSSGVPTTLIESWKDCGSITMHIAYILRSMVIHRRNSQVTPSSVMPTSTGSTGWIIVAGYTSCLRLREQQFAMHTVTC